MTGEVDAIGACNALDVSSASKSGKGDCCDSELEDHSENQCSDSRVRH